MKLNDMTIADIESAATNKSYEYAPLFRKAAKGAFTEGACWAYGYLTRQGNDPSWCEQSGDLEMDVLISDALLRNNGWKCMSEGDFYMLAEEVNGITVIFEYRLSNQALFFCDALIPYPVSRLSQIKAVFDVLKVDKAWKVAVPPPPAPDYKPISC